MKVKRYGCTEIVASAGSTENDFMLFIEYDKRWRYGKGSELEVVCISSLISCALENPVNFGME